MTEYLSILQTTALFADIAKEDIGAMLTCLDARVLTYQKGTPVFLEGDVAGFVGIVLSGAVQIVKDDYYGNRSVLSHAEEGEIFAESFSFGDVDVMPVSAYALQNTTVMLLDCRKMLTVCANSCGFHNQLVKNLLKIVARKNLMLSRKIEVMSRKTTREKLMAYLLDYAKRQDAAQFVIPLDRQALADFLGVERSAMSTEIGRLKKDGILDSRGSWFHIYPPK